LLQQVSHPIEDGKREKDGWIKGRMESSRRIGVCSNRDSRLAERGGKKAKRRAQPCPACTVPYIERLFREQVEYEHVIHMDHVEVPSSGLQSYEGRSSLMP